MGSKQKGVNIYLEVWTGAWTKVGGQKDCTIDRGASSYDVTDKDSGGWEESLVGIKNWSISFDSFLIESADDPGVLQLESDYEGDTINNYRITTPNHTYIGNAIIEGFSFTGPLSDASSVSFTLKGTGALAKV